MTKISRHRVAQSADVMVVLIIPGEETAAKGLGILDAAEALGELRLVFQGFEMRLREGVVVRGMRPAMRLGDTKVGQQEGGCLGLHRSAAIGVQRQLTGWDTLLGESLVKQVLEEEGRKST